MNIIVTGASGNLGQAVVRQFLTAGWTVIGLVMPGDKTPMDIMDKKFVKVEVDLADEMHTSLALGRIIKKRGTIDVAVLTAGGFAMGDIEKTHSRDILQQYKLNFETTYHAARPIFLQMLTQKKGRIFMVGSRPGSNMTMSKGMTAYGLTKSLIFRLAELMNAEAKGTDVVTTVVVPSIIDTPTNRKKMKGEDFSTWMDPKQMAEVIQFYTTPAADGLREPVLKMYNKA
ncbi:MAG: SDR family NAD(P)-dependent oxidoreductase [Sphingobacteriales bacterium]|nr:MAG: SDR family NAD(P)-dependent oxidoreductase [Sphingobacteriales bacterium]